MSILTCKHLSFILFEMFTCEFDCFFVLLAIFVL